MGITINQTYAKIGIDRSPSSLEITTNNAKLELKQKQPKINMHTELPKIQIDQHEAFASTGLKNALDSTKEAAQLGYQSAIRYIGKVAEDGDTLAGIEDGGNPIVDISVRDANPEHEFGMVTMPTERPEISVVEGSVNIEPERTSEGATNGVQGEYTPGNIDFKYTPSIVKIYMAQYASVNIKYVDNKIDTFV